MNREFVLTIPQRERLNTFIISTRYSTKELAEAIWEIDSKNMKIWLNLWMESLDYPNHEFEIIPNGENYKLIIYTND